MQVLFLIIARGGSRGVPNKNLRRLGGISLVGYRALSARKSRYCSRLIISTDSTEIQDEARAYGVEVPFTRPAELATDTAATVDVVSHAIEWLEREGKARYEAVMLLEPSSPFARPLDYDRAVELMAERKADVVVGVRRVEVNSLFVGPLDDQGRITCLIDNLQGRRRLRRQDLPQEYTMNGALYLFGWRFFRQHRSLYQSRSTTYGYVMEPEYSLDIDTLQDLHFAEFLVENGYVDLSYWR